MTEKEDHPPRLAEWLLSRVLPSRQLEFVLGDLQEDFVREIKRSGSARARWWYWSRTLACLAAVRVGTNHAPRKPGQGKRRLIPLYEFRHAARRLRLDPAFTATAVGILALGLGAVTSMSSVAYGVLFRPLPYPEPERLVWLNEVQQHCSSCPFATADFLAFRERSRSFSHLAAYYAASVNLTLTGFGEARRVRAYAVTGDYFPLFGSKPALGRFFREGEFVAGTATPVVLSHELWKSKWAGDPGLIGRSITLDGQALEVVGIASENAPYPVEVDLWIPFRPSESRINRRNMGHELAVLGRLREGVSHRQAESELQTIARRLDEEFDISGHSVSVVLLADKLRGSLKLTIWMLLGATGLLLLVAITNLAGLFVVRTLRNLRDVAVRRALGAGILRLSTHFLLEGLLVGLAGLTAGLGLAWVLVRLTESHFSAMLPPLTRLSLPPEIAAAATLLLVLVVLALVALPVRQASQLEMSSTLRGRGARSFRQGGGLVNRSLISLQLAVSMSLLVGAGLLLRTLERLSEVELGFATQDRVAVSLNLPSGRYRSGAEREVALQELRQRLQALPAVVDVGMTTSHPFIRGATSAYLRVPGRNPQEHPLVEKIRALPNYFESAGLELTEGRYPSLTAGSREVAISSTLAKTYWPQETPLGATLSEGEGSPDLTVVGVVKDVRLYSLREQARSILYTPYSALPDSDVVLIVHTSNMQTNPLEMIRKEVQAFDSQMAVFAATTLDEALAVTLRGQRLSSKLLTSLAGLALLLAAVGLYGSLAYSVRQRRFEIAVRLALGACRKDILAMVTRQGLLATAAGILLGAIGANALGQYLTSQLYGVTATDGWTYAGAALVLVITSVVAALIPARGAARYDPAIALRVQ